MSSFSELKNDGNRHFLFSLGYIMLILNFGFSSFHIFENLIVEKYLTVWVVSIEMRYHFSLTVSPIAAFNMLISLGLVDH